MTDIQLKKFSEFLLFLTQESSNIKGEKQRFLEDINYQIYALIHTIKQKNCEFLSQKDIENLFNKYKIPFSKSLLYKTFFQRTQTQGIMKSQELCEFFNVGKVYSQRKYTSVQLQPTEIKRFTELLQSEIHFRTEIQQRKQYLKTICNFQTVFNQIDFFQNGYIDSYSIFQFVKFYTRTEINQNASNYIVNIICNSKDRIELQEFKHFFEQKIASKTFLVSDIDSVETSFEQKVVYGKIKHNTIQRYKSNDNLRRFNNYDKINNDIQSSDKSLTKINHANNKKSNNNTILNINLNYKDKKKGQFRIQSFKRNHPRNYEYLQTIKNFREEKPLDILQTQKNIQLQITEQHKKYQQYLTIKSKSKTREDIRNELKKINALLLKREQIIQEMLKFQQFNSLNAFNILDHNQIGFLNFKQFYKSLELLHIQINEEVKTIFWKEYSVDSKFSYQNFLNLFLINWKLQFYNDIRNRQAIVIDFKGINTWKSQIQKQFKKFLKQIIQNTVQIKKQKILISVILENISEANILTSIEQKWEFQISVNQFTSILGEKFNALFSQITKNEEQKLTISQFKQYFKK